MSSPTSTVSFKIRDTTKSSSFLGYQSKTSYSVTFKIVNTQPTFSAALPTNLKICHTKLNTLPMPAATDLESHLITYKCTSTEPSVSCDSVAKVISFAATQTKVTTPINVALNARDEDTSSPGTTVTLSVTHNAPPKYTTPPATTPVLINHSDYNSKDIALPPRAECLDPEGSACILKNPVVAFTTSGSVPITAIMIA